MKETDQSKEDIVTVNAESPDWAEKVVPIESDPLYIESLNLMQQGQWREAGETLVTLELRYPGSAELRQARQILALHLSAEQTWNAGMSGRVRSTMHAPVVCILLVANLLLYLLLGTLCVLIGSPSAAS